MNVLQRSSEARTWPAEMASVWNWTKPCAWPRVRSQLSPPSICRKSFRLTARAQCVAGNWLAMAAPASAIEPHSAICGWRILAWILSADAVPVLAPVILSIRLQRFWKSALTPTAAPSNPLGQRSVILAGRQVSTRRLANRNGAGPLLDQRAGTQSGCPTGGARTPDWRALLLLQPAAQERARAGRRHAPVRGFGQVATLARPLSQ